MGGIRQQFSLQENIELSLFGADFLRRERDNKLCWFLHGSQFKNIISAIESDEFLGLDQQNADVQYHPCGYLFLTTTSDGAQLLHDNYTLQK